MKYILVEISVNYPSELAELYGVLGNVKFTFIIEGHGMDGTLNIYTYKKQNIKTEIKKRGLNIKDFDFGGLDK